MVLFDFRALVCVFGMVLYNAYLALVDSQVLLSKRLLWTK
jgi:hypothetical protein